MRLHGREQPGAFLILVTRLDDTALRSDCSTCGVLQASANTHGYVLVVPGCGRGRPARLAATGVFPGRRRSLPPPRRPSRPPRAWDPPPPRTLHGRRCPGGPLSVAAFDAGGRGPPPAGGARPATAAGTPSTWW